MGLSSAGQPYRADYNIQPKSKSSLFIPISLQPTIRAQVISKVFACALVLMPIAATAEEVDGTVVAVDGHVFAACRVLTVSDVLP